MSRSPSNTHPSSSQRIKEFLDQALFWSFCLLVFLVPLVFSRQTQESFALPKITLLRIGTIFLFTLWLIVVLLSPQIRIRKSPLNWPIGIFIGIALLSTLFSIHFPTSFFGKYERYEGFLTLLSFALLYFLALQVNWKLERLKIFFKWLVAAAGIISFYGLMQFFGYDIFKWKDIFFELNRSFSTFGNPSLLASYLVLTLPLAFALTLNTYQWERLLWGGVTILILFCLLTTFARGGWIAGIVAILTFGFFIRRKLWQERKTLAFLFIIFLGIIVFVTSFSAKSSAPVTNLVSRATSTVQIGEGSIATRLETWKSAWKMMRDRSLLGFGPDTFRLAYPRYETLRGAQLNGRLFIVDNTHNYLLQLSSTMGFPALLTFLTIVGLFIWYGVKIFRREHQLLNVSGNLINKTNISRGDTKDNENDRLEAFLEQKRKFLLVAGIIASALGYLVSILFTVNEVGSAFLFWIFLGLLFSQETFSSEIEGTGKESSIGIRGALSGLTLALALILAGASIFPYLADIHYRLANNLYSKAQVEEAVLHYQKAMKQNPYLDNYPRYLGELYLDWAQAGGTKADFDQAIAALKLAQRKSPLDIANYTSLGRAYLFGGRKYNPRYYSQAIETLNKALELSPQSATFHYLLGSVYLDGKEHAKARRELRLAVRSDPGYTEAYVALGASYRQTGEKKRAIKAFEKALKLEPSWKEVRQALQYLKGSP